MIEILPLRDWRPVPADDPSREAALPLAEAALCADCQTLYHTRRATCPSCGSRTGYNVARWLDREATA